VALAVLVFRWSTELRSVIDEALSLQRTTSLYVFGNSDGQPYTKRIQLEPAPADSARRDESGKGGAEFTRCTRRVGHGR
jgi:hypothetical protein